MVLTNIDTDVYTNKRSVINAYSMSFYDYLYQVIYWLLKWHIQMYLIHISAILCIKCGLKVGLK